MKILIVEDIDNSRLIFERILKDHNCNFCQSATEMYDELATGKYDLIIMDVGLPGPVTGLQLIEELKCSEKYKYIKIICVTVHSYNEKKAYNSGADAFLPKPFSKLQLLNMIEKIFSD